MVLAPPIAVAHEGGDAANRRWATSSKASTYAIRAPVAATANAKGDAATRYLRFLQTPAAKAIFEKYGFSFLVKPAA